MLEVVAAEVQRDVAEAVDDQRDRADPVLPHFRLRELEPHELVRVDRRAELLERHAGGEVRSGRREQVTAVERAGHRLQRVLRIRELVCLGHSAEALGGGQEQPVVGADVQPALPVAQGESTPAAAHARIDDREVDSGGHVGQRVREHERALEHVSRPDAVRDVDHAGVGRDGGDDAVAGADEVVLQPEVGQEGDDHEQGT